MKENPGDKMRSHNIDELFRSAIDPYEEPPSLEVWGQVEKGLDRYGIVQIKRNYDNFRKIAVALVLLLSSALLYELQTRNTIAGKSESNSVTVDSRVKSSNLNSTPNRKKEGTNLNKQDLTKLNADATKKPVDAIIDLNKNFQAGNVKEPINYFHQQFVPADAGIVKEEKTSLRANKHFEHPFSQDDLAVSQESLTSAIPFLFDRSSFKENIFTTLEQYHEPIIVKDPVLSLASPVVLTNGTTLHDQSIHLTSARKRSPFSLSLIFSPDFTSRRVKEDWPINREDNKDEIRKSERYAFSYSFGALVDYKINHHWFIQTGFTLSRAVINIEPKFIFARPDLLGDMKYKFNSSSGYSFLTSKTASRPAFGDSLHAFGSSSSLQYVSVPLAVKYKVGKKKWSVYGVAGAEAHILVKDKIETSLGGNHENAVNKDIRGLKPVYYSALLAAGAEYNISKTLAVNITPTARFALTSINKDVPVKAYQHSLGLVAGVQLSF